MLHTLIDRLYIGIDEVRATICESAAGYSTNRAAHIRARATLHWVA